MPNFIDEYLLKLGATVDTAGLNRFQNALREASVAVDKVSTAMAGSFFKAQTEILGGFAAIGGAALGLVDKVAMADQEFRLFGLHMYMSKDAARSLKVAMDALGQPMENLMWDPELRARTRQLIADQRSMAPTGDFDEQMRKIRDVRFEFTRMEVELKYLGMHVVQDFMRALGLGPDTLLARLRGFNDWVTHHLPEISARLVNTFLPVWKDIKEVFYATGEAMRSVANAFADIVGLLTGDSAILKATDTFDKFGEAVHKVSHIFAVFAETLDNVVDLLAHLVSALVHLSTGQFKAAGTDLQAAVKDVNARTVGAALMVGTAFVAPELLPEEAEAEAGGAAGGGLLARLFARGVGFFGRHPVIAGGVGANLGDLLTDRGEAAPDLIQAVEAQESGALGMSARSSAGAIGTMQLMPGTARGLGVNPYDAAQNVAGGTAYLNQLLARYHGDTAEALGAYNAGPGRMDAFLAGKATLPAETQNYIASVLSRTGQKGDVNVGGITIHIAGTNARPDDIARTVVQRIRESQGKEAQRNMQEFSQQSYSY